MQINDILSLENLMKQSTNVGKVSGTKSGDEAVKGADFLRAIDMQNPNYNNPVFSKEDSLADDISSKAAISQADSNRASVAFGMSDWDYKSMQDQGHSPSDMDAKDFVTIADKIKMALAKGGMDVSIMGGISDDAIAAMSDYPQMVKAALKANDMPASDNLVSEGASAMRMVDEISASSNEGYLSDETVKYMLKNQLSPTINDIYTATVSSNDGAAIQNTTTIDRGDAGLNSQVEAIIKGAGAEVSSENIDVAYWMMESDIELNVEQFKLYGELSELNVFDLTNTDVLTSLVDAVGQGNSPKDAYLVEGYSVMDQAKDVKMVVDNAINEDIDAIIAEGKPVTVRELATQQLSRLMQISNETYAENAPSTQEVSPQLAAKRLLLETQLMMTTEANYSLIMKGVAIDTLPLNELVDALYEQESEYYRAVLGDDDADAVMTFSEKIEIFEETEEVIDSTQKLPVAALGLMDDVHKTTLRFIHTHGQQYAEAKFANASNSYETMSTEVRRDLGDSIQKAFGNIDEILKGIDLEATESNRRAVRILGYNEIEITVESVEKVKDADMTVNRAFNALKPAVVAEMIRRGQNPLDLSMDELIEKAEEILSTTEAGSEEEKYAKFLWKLEQESAISEEERNSFIGVYRLIHQVEATDGAAIGQLLQQNVPLTMRNLMMAVRTAKQEGTEYEISDEFGEVAEFNRDSLSITEQIEMAFQLNAVHKAGEEITPHKMAAFESEDAYMQMSPDTFADALTDMNDDSQIARAEENLERAYTQERHAAMNRALEAESEVYAYLDANNIPTTANTLSAVTALFENSNKMYKTLFRQEAKRQVGLDRAKHLEGDELEAELNRIMSDLIKEFGESCKTPEDMADAQEKLEELAENVMKTTLVEEDVQEIDVRGMKLIQTQISTLGQIAEQSETYTIPIMVADEQGNLNLKIVRGVQDKGLVDVAFSLDNLGGVRASFRYEAGEVRGNILADNADTWNKLLDNGQALHESIVSATDGLDVSLNFGMSKKMEPADMFKFTEPDFEVSENKDNNIKTSTLYGIARGFITAVSNI